MDSKELRNLHEAYLDVYAPQENIEEGLRSAVKRLLGGGKKKQNHLNQKVEENNFAKNIMLVLRNQTPQQRDKFLIGLVQKQKKMKKIMEINHSRSKLLKNLKQHTTDI
jgi:hypothetical protein